MEENFHLYELNYFLSPHLSDEEVLNFSQKIADFINSIQGRIEKTNEPKIQKLAYSIKKQERGHFGEIRFSAEAEKISELEKKLKLEEKILRFGIFTVPVAKQKPEKPAKKPKIQPSEPSPSETKVVARKAKPEAKKEKVKLEDIDKKLEEIIGNI